MAIDVSRQKEAGDFEYYRGQVQNIDSEIESLLWTRDRYNAVLGDLHRLLNPEASDWTPPVAPQVTDRPLPAQPPAPAAARTPAAPTTAPVVRTGPALVAPAAPQAARPTSLPKPPRGKTWKQVFGKLSQPMCLVLMARHLGGELSVDEALGVLTHKDVQKLKMEGRPARTRVLWNLQSPKAWDQARLPHNPFEPVAGALDDEGLPTRFRLVQDFPDLP